MTKKAKQIIVAFIIIIVAFIIFKMIPSNSSSSNTTLVTDQANSAQIIDGQRILVLLNNLNKVTLDETIFSNKIFTSLVSFERPIPDEDISRKNPFLPIGADNSTTPLPTATSTLKTPSIPKVI